MGLEKILDKITWQDVRRLHPCQSAIEYCEQELKLASETRITNDALKKIRRYNSEWADWFLYNAACDVEGLTGKQRFELVRCIKDEEMRYACDVEGLTGKQRKVLRQPYKSTRRK